MCRSFRQYQHLQKRDSRLIGFCRKVAKEEAIFFICYMLVFLGLFLKQVMTFVPTGKPCSTSVVSLTCAASFHSRNQTLDISTDFYYQPCKLNYKTWFRLL